MNAHNNRELVYKALINIAPGVIWSRFGRFGTSFVSARIAMDALRHYGILAEPMVAQLEIMNSQYKALLAERKVRPQTQADAADWNQAGAVNLWVLNDSPALSYSPGYYVTMVDQNKMIDLALSLSSRLDKHITIRPSIFEMPAGWREGKTKWHRLEMNGCELRYLACPKSTAFLKCSAWINARWQSITDTITKEMTKWMCMCSSNKRAA